MKERHILFSAAVIQFLDSRLSAKVWQRAIPEPNSGCWLWIGSIHSNGYGRVYGDGRHWNAHRFVYTKLVGVIPNELQLDHLCRNTLCVNPAHLEPVTARVNTMRSQAITAKNAQATHCKRGHELTGNNVITTKLGRNCRTCRNQQRLEYFGRLSREQRDEINARRRKRSDSQTGLRDIKERGIDAHTADLERELDELPAEFGGNRK